MSPIYQATNIIEAAIIKGLLQQFGITAHYSGFYLQGGIGELPVTGHTAVWVDEAQAAQARTIIEHYENS